MRDPFSDIRNKPLTRVDILYYLSLIVAAIVAVDFILTHILGVFPG